MALQEEHLGFVSIKAFLENDSVFPVFILSLHSD